MDVQEAFHDLADNLKKYIDDIVDQIEERLIAIEAAETGAERTAAERIDGLEKRLAVLEGKSPTKPRVKVPAKGVPHG